MQPTTFRNFQPNDHIKTQKGEVFEITERLTYFCKGCDCKFPYFCEEMTSNTMLTIRSQRGEWELSLKTLNEKCEAKDITEIQWR